VYISCQEVSLPSCMAWYSNYGLLDKQMHTEYHDKLTLIFLTDTECAVPFDFLGFVRDFINLPPDFTLPPGITTPDVVTLPPGMTTPSLPFWPERFNRVDDTYMLMILYASFNVAWAVTCIIAVGKLKQPALEDPMLKYNTQHYREAFRCSCLPWPYVILYSSHDRSNRSSPYFSSPTFLSTSRSVQFAAHNKAVFQTKQFVRFYLNPLSPNDVYICRTAPLTSRHCILDIYSTNVRTEYFKCAA
jgi:hypothetical protein